MAYRCGHLTRPGWCQRPGLNRRPKAYESSALPLSYSGEPPLGTERGYYASAKRGDKQFRRSLRTRDHKFADRRPAEIRAKVGNLTPSEDGFSSCFASEREFRPVRAPLSR